MPSWTSTWAAISWMWCGTDRECPAQRGEGLFSVVPLSVCSPSISPSLPLIQQISTDHHWEVGFPGGASGKEPTCQSRRHKRLWVWNLGWEDPLEEGMATHSSILAWRIPWTVRCGGLQSMGSHRVRHDWIPWCLASSGARLGAFRDQIYHFRHIPFPHLIQKAGKIIVILSSLLDYMMIKRLCIQMAKSTVSACVCVPA